MTRLKIIIVCLALCLGFTSLAQDIEGEMALFGFGDNIEFSYNQVATSGVLNANADTTYTLTLEGITEDIVLFSLTDMTETPYNLSDLVLDWQPLLGQEGIVAEGELSFSGGTLYGFITAVDYNRDNQTLNYTLIVNQVISTDVLAQPFDPNNANFSSKDIPAEVENPVFTVSGSTQLFLGLQRAALQRLQSVRFDDTCESAQANLETALMRLRDARNMSADDVRVLRNEIRYIRAWLVANCIGETTP
jgi:hypothetical protein